jgi:deoxycytidine triphosphate deaminase
VYLSGRDIKWAIDCGKLIVDPRPEALGCGYDETSIDLHLSPVSTARVWNLDALRRMDMVRGAQSEDPPEIHVGTFDWNNLSRECQVEVPLQHSDPERARRQLVYRRNSHVVVRRFGFVLWPTRERVGTPRVTPDLSGPKLHPELICFVNAKSTRARTGLLVHFTAPTIHAGWDGNIILEISNLGPFTFVLKEGDALAQLTVATISSAPDLSIKISRSQTQGQTDPTGAPTPAAGGRARRPRRGAT